MNILIILLGLFAHIKINVLGEFYLIEVTLFFIIVFTFITNLKSISFSSFKKNCLIFLLLWFFGLFISDIYRETAFEDYAKGWGNLVFFGINFIGLSILIKNNYYRLLYFMIASSLGSIIITMLSPSEAAKVMVWKFGYGGPLTGLITFFASTLSNSYTILLMIFMAFINILLDFRSIALIGLFTAITILYIRFKYYSKFKFNKIASAIFIILVLLFFKGVYEIYTYSYDIDFFIDVGQRKFHNVDQNLLYARLGILPSLIAAIDSPIIGHGSWPKGREYIDLYNEMLFELGKEAGYNSAEYIDCHSFLIGSWVQAGILGVFLWLYVLFNAVKSIKYAILLNIKYLPFVIFALYNLIYSIFFSGFAGYERVSVASILILIDIILRLLQNRSQDPLKVT